MLLTKDQILNSDDIGHEDVDVPEWGGSVTIREMTGRDRDAFEQSTYQKNGSDYQVNLKNMRARLAAISIVDDDGVRMFSDAEVEKLAEKSAKALDRIFAACQDLNGLSGDDVEELAKNLEQTQVGGSTSS